MAGRARAACIWAKCNTGTESCFRDLGVSAFNSYLYDLNAMLETDGGGCLAWGNLSVSRRVCWIRSPKWSRLALSVFCIICLSPARSDPAWSGFLFLVARFQTAQIILHTNRPCSTRRWQLLSHCLIFPVLTVSVWRVNTYLFPPCSCQVLPAQCKVLPCASSNHTERPT